MYSVHLMLIMSASASLVKNGAPFVLIIANQSVRNDKEVVFHLENEANVTWFLKTNASLDEITTELWSDEMARQAQIIIGCLGNVLEKQVVSFARYHNIPFVCMEPSNQLTQGQPFMEIGQSPLSTAESIYLVAKETLASHVIFLGSQEQTADILPVLMLRDNSRLFKEKEKLFTFAGIDELSRLSTKIEQQRSEMRVSAFTGKRIDTITVVIAILADLSIPMNGSLWNSTFDLFPTTQTYWLVFNHGNWRSIEDVGISDLKKRHQLLLVDFPHYNDPSVLVDVFLFIKRTLRTSPAKPNATRTINSPETYSNASLFYRNLEATLKEYKHGKTTCNIRRLMRKNSSNVATIKDGKLFPFDNSMRPNLLCKDPAAICVTLIPSDPVTLVGEDVVTSQADCTLGHICTQYEPVNASDPTKGKRPVLHCCYGFTIDLLVSLERDLGVQFEMYIVQDLSSWNNLVGEVVLGRADLAAAPIAITNARLKDVEYASPIQQLEIYIVMSQNRAKISLDWLAFIRPFDNSLWFVIFGLSFALVFYIWWMDQWSPYGRDNKKILSDPSNFTLPVSFSYVFSSVFKINLDDVTARSPSARFTYAVFSFGTLIMVSSYTANLTASLVQELQTFPISGIYDEKFQDPNSGFTFATEKGASVEFLLKRSANPALTSVSKNMIYSGVNTDNLELLHTGKLDAYIYYTPYIGHMASKKTGAKFKLVGKRIHSETSSFAFQKGSPWIANISSQFRKYASQEYFKETEKKWFNSLDQDVVLQAEEITLLHFRGLFLSLPGATGLSILVLVLEKYVYRRSTRKVRRIQVKGAGDGMQQPGHSESNINEKVLSIT